MSGTLFDKIWNNHVVKTIEGGPDVLFIDREYMHEVTSPAAFENIRRRGIKPLMPERITAICDHNIPTHNHLRPVQDPLSEAQISALERNTTDFNIPFFGLDHPYNGILHVVGPELGLTQPGMTIVCGDSHTSTHGALGCIAFGIGTSEVETVTATQCLLQYKPKQMNIKIEGSLSKGVTSKDLALYILSQYGTDLGTGYFIEFSGSTISSLSVESRMTLCNMSIEMGARGALIAPDSKTIEYIRHTPYAPKNFDKAITHWQTLFSDPDAIFDKIIEVNASNVSAMITYGTNPGMAMPLDGVIPDNSDDKKFVRALRYMGFAVGEKLIGKPIQNVFIGSCTNGRIEDFRLAAEIMRDKKVADGITVWIVPGSNRVLQQIKAEGLDTVFKNAGAEVRLPGCSACLGMNADRVPSGNYCVSTSNRNFEGRQGAGARTILASPITASAAAVTGLIVNPIEFI
ncbi:MAG: 3-isopropylmalate dehydratase large subunit [Bacteroidales bacterium]|nr:3-isopropylmalate dehydratase large subunit [Bacteroidales bacterium]